MYKEKSIAIIKSKRKKLIREIVWKSLWYLIMVSVGFTMLLPFIWMISTSLKQPGAVFTFPPQWFPKPFIWKNYINAWKLVPFGRFYINSLFVAVAQTLGVLFTSSFAAFAFARLEFKGRDKIFFLYLATMMLPYYVTMIPTFIFVRLLGWINTYYALIVPGLFSAYGTFLLRQFFMTIPTSLEDAAKVDGCSKIGIFRHVIIPLSKPALATLGTLTFIASWNNFMWPLIVINSLHKETLPIGLASFQGLYSTNWPLLMAGSVIVMVPALIVFIFNQRFFVEGIKLTGMKY